ncbi:AEC family transporter [Vibrio algarum]|uniref:AEC family transporter n=1 Tax=Vibrio algarum TaxID=3020714 RepID=A0ABT4YSD3_9VIBR|nr:AEC family transporter [Vibrio sp. KJ40-1]MDB1124390.1 AEC family transporter [Vibrio sp. KJ40-1]
MHQQLITLLALIIISFSIGLWFQKRYSEISQPFSVALGKFTLTVIIPYSILTSIWQLPKIEAQLFYLPLVGVGVIFLGALVGFVTVKLKRLQPKQAGALVSVTSFYNLGALGNLCAFFIFGESGVAIVALYKLCEELIYFGGIYPYARKCGDQHFKQGKSAFWRDPIFLAAISAISIGLLLNISGFNRPMIIGDINQYVIPLGSLMMVFSVGLTFNLRGGERWKKLAIQVSVFRAFLSPAIAMLLITVFDLWAVYDGLAAKVCILLSVMPTGFTSTIPTVLYRLDSDLANTAWFYSYLAFFIAFPITVALL